jgi:hypothetical protein
MMTLSLKMKRTANRDIRLCLENATAETRAFLGLFLKQAVNHYITMYAMQSRKVLPPRTLENSVRVFQSLI